jgi:hypothetical protein
MASAHEVLKEALHEARLILRSPTLGTREDLRSLLRLAQTAADAGDGDVPNEQVLAAPLHWTGLTRLGLASERVA